MKHVVQFSGGVTSWAAARRVADQHGTKDLVLLFADTKIEDKDTYRFLHEAAENIGVPVTVVADGRTPFQVYRDERFLGNSRVDPCSKILKRIPLDRWKRANCDPADTTLYFGIHLFEQERLHRLRARMIGWRVEAPLCESDTYLSVDEVHAWAEREGLSKQWLYRIGMPHANCGGGCCKMGQGGWTNAYHHNRPVYDLWEREENSCRDQLGDVSMMKDRTGGETKPLTLTMLRQRIEANQQIDMFDLGGCGCLLADGDEA